MFLKQKKEAEKRKTCVAIVPAAGSSTRMKQCGDKLFLSVCDTPIITLTLSSLQNSPYIDEIIIPTREDLVDEIKKLCEAISLDKVKSVVSGGKTRSESVLNGIIEAGNRFDLVAIHDAARPFISQKIIADTILAAAKYNAAAPAVPLKDTVKEAESRLIKRTVPRDSIVAIQTPQVFDATLIAGALKKAVDENSPITDDCSAVEQIGMRVFLTDGDYFNIKITTPEDLIFAEAIFKNRNEATL
ncbi:MAG: 2-C-methyl-D-erythritol 4-phosphate cytidylyltransferase [Oscillospiraceae bacterium]|nr:2-C-methyl-D-erythritol 4-phosphate cytidylyltransferase [Oscillospiraceae bacterium]